MWHVTFLHEGRKIQVSQRRGVREGQEAQVLVDGRAHLVNDLDRLKIKLQAPLTGRLAGVPATGLHGNFFSQVPGVRDVGDVAADVRAGGEAGEGEESCSSGQRSGGQVFIAHRHHTARVPLLQGLPLLQHGHRAK